MAHVKIESIVEHLSTEMKRALEEAVRSVIPNTQFDSGALYRQFVKSVYRQCSVWERVPDKYIKTE